MKIIAIGNVLMEDDGIAIAIVGMLETELLEMGIEVIYGETDVGYCITRIEDGDFLILMDAARFDEIPGQILQIPLHEYQVDKRNLTQHNMSIADLLKLHFTKLEGFVLAIQIVEVDFCYGLSPLMQDKIMDIAQEIIKKIRKMKMQWMGFHSMG